MIDSPVTTNPAFFTSNTTRPRSPYHPHPHDTTSIPSQPHLRNMQVYSTNDLFPSSPPHQHQQYMLPTPMMTSVPNIPLQMMPHSQSPTNPYQPTTTMSQPEAAFLSDMFKAEREKSLTL